MTDHAHELRRYARKIAHPAGDVPAVMLAAADEIERLQSVIEAMEQQEPVAWLIDWADEPDLGHYFSESAVDEDSGRSRPLFLHPVPAPSLPERITHDQAPHVYSQEAAEGYADGWNACVKEIVAAAPQNCIKAAMEAQR